MVSCRAVSQPRSGIINPVGQILLFSMTDLSSRCYRCEFEFDKILVRADHIPKSVPLARSQVSVRVAPFLSDWGILSCHRCTFSVSWHVHSNQLHKKNQWGNSKFVHCMPPMSFLTSNSAQGSLLFLLPQYPYFFLGHRRHKSSPIIPSMLSLSVFLSLFPSSLQLNRATVRQENKV